MKFKGSLKDPFSFLGLVSATLFIFVLVTPFLNSALEKENISFLKTFPSTYAAISYQEPFLSSVNNFLAESPGLFLIENSSLRAVSPPVLVSSKVLGAFIYEGEPVEEKKEIREYIVEDGDTLSSLAEEFGISLNTILWANDLTSKSVIKPGQKLIIPPVNGIIYHVKDGDTISEIARAYKSKVGEIVAFNELSNENDIHIGDILIIPGGVMPSPTVKVQPSPINIPLTDSQFILPVSSPYIITQGLHWYNAVDFSHSGISCGKPIFAAAGGTIQKTGYDGIYGNYIRILHPSGVVTLYAHLSVITVKNGASVNVGNIIGYIGNTGRTRGISGCHLHFEVRGAKNPFAR